MPPTLIDGRFDGMELCPLNPDAAEKSPFYVFAWQHAAAMSTEEENGSVYVFDVAG